MLNQFLEAGRVVGTHGIQGELRIEPWCDSAAFLAGFQTLYWDKGDEPIKVVSSRVHKNLLLLKVAGVDTIEQGDALRGRILYIDRGDVELPEGRYFMQDMIGLEAVDADTGRSYGRLTEVLRTGANDVYQITAGTGEARRDYLIPVIPDVIIEVDLNARKLSIRPIRGIFDDED